MPAPPDVARRRDRPPTPELVGPDDPTRGRRLAWAVLLKRTWGLSVLVCPRCSGPMRLVAAIEDPVVAQKILRHLGLPARPPPRGPPRRAQPELAREPHAHDEHEGVDAPSAFE